jgi:hypothetical protein
VRTDSTQLDENISHTKYRKYITAKATQAAKIVVKKEKKVFKASG